MSDKQIEASQVANRKRVFAAISQKFDLLPDRFKGGEIERMCGFKSNPFHRMLVASVLITDFKCRQVGSGPNKAWVKP